jgi:hypothetical protein
MELIQENLQVKNQNSYAPEAGYTLQRKESQMQ